MTAGPDDWRRRGQEDYLTGARFERRHYQPPPPATAHRDHPWDHEHCELCWATFMPAGASRDPAILTEGYVTDDDRWVCDRCFADFRDELSWTLIGA